MDVSAQVRKEELELKKMKLAMMREEKRKREEEKQREKLKFISSGEARLIEPDDVLKELGITAPTIFNNLTNGYDGDETKSQLNLSKKFHNHETNKLTLSTITLTNIPPKEKVCYNKGIQINIPTEQEVSEEKNKAIHDYYVLTYANHDDNEYEEHLPSNLNFEKTLPNSSSNNTFTKNTFSSDHSNKRPSYLKISDNTFPIVELNEEEVGQIITEPEFKIFFDHCTKIVKRVLNDNYDISIDYSKHNIETQKLERGEKNRTNLNFCFFDENLCLNRSITSLDWNTQFPELIASSYYRNSSSCYKECDGQVLIWNTRFRNNEPEYIFNFQSTISCVSFAKFHPNLIIGGCYSGQVVIWDNRYNKKTPVQRTPLTVKAHTQPICGLETVGTYNSHSLITLSTDGKLCDWSSSLDSLSTPSSSIDLLSNNPAGSIPLNLATSNSIPSVTCFAFPTQATLLSSNEPILPKPGSLVRGDEAAATITSNSTNGDDNIFVVGCEQGSLFSAKRHGIKNGVNEIFDNHKGPITEIHFNPSTIPEYANLFISSSTDWSIKLWSLKPQNDIVNSLNLNSSNNNMTNLLSKNSSSSSQTNTSLHQITSPLMTIDCYEDYIYSVQWSPINPFTFACATGSGQLDIWKINYSLEEPLYSEKVTNTAINKLKWNHSGTQIMAGDDSGKLWLYDVGQNLNQPISSMGKDVML